MWEKKKKKEERSTITIRELIKGGNWCFAEGIIVIINGEVTLAESEGRKRGETKRQERASSWTTSGEEEETRKRGKTMSLLRN